MTAFIFLIFYTKDVQEENDIWRFNDAQIKRLRAWDLVSQSNARTHNRYFSSQNSHLSSSIITSDIEILQVWTSRNFSQFFQPLIANKFKKKLVSRRAK